MHVSIPDEIAPAECYPTGVEDQAFASRSNSIHPTTYASECYQAL